jgi:ATP-dependent Lon protease
MLDKDVNKFLEHILEEGVKKTEIVDKSEKTLPIIALRGKVLFPNTFLNFDVGREISVTAVDVSVKSGSEIFICAQKNSAIEIPKVTDFFTVGVVAKIKQVIKIQSSGHVKVSVEALYRAGAKDIKEAPSAFRPQRS